MGHGQGAALAIVTAGPDDPVHSRTLGSNAGPPPSKCLKNSPVVATISGDLSSRVGMACRPEEPTGLGEPLPTSPAHGESLILLEVDGPEWHVL